MKEPKQISAFQSSVIVINSSIGVSVLALPRIASEKVGAGALMVTGIAMCIAMISVFILSKLSKRFPGESIVKYGQKIIGKPLGKIFGFMLICLFVGITSLVLREFGEVMNTSLLQDTPLPVTLFSMLLLVAVATRNNITTIAYLHTYYLPFIVAPIIFMVLIGLQDVEWRHLKPFLGNDTTFTDFLGGGIAVAGLPFIQIGLFIITVVTPHMMDPKRIVKGAMWGILISSIVILLAVGITVAVFGSEEIDNSLWPMLVLTRMTELPAAILERLDILFLIVWIISAFTTLLSGYLISIELSSQLFGLQSHRVLSYLALPVVLGLSVYPDNVLHLYQIIKTGGKWGLILTIGYPFLLLLVAMARGKGESHEKQSNA